MTRESAAAKAERYLLEGRLVVTSVHLGAVEATCRGDGHVYRLEYRPERGWSCTCEARSRTGCSHLLALRKVVAVDLLERGRTR